MAAFPHLRRIVTLALVVAPTSAFSRTIEATFPMQGGYENPMGQTSVINEAIDYRLRLTVQPDYSANLELLPLNPDAIIDTPEFGKRRAGDLIKPQEYKLYATDEHLNSFTDLHGGYKLNIRNERPTLDFMGIDTELKNLKVTELGPALHTQATDPRFAEAGVARLTQKLDHSAPKTVVQINKVFPGGTVELQAANAWPFRAEVSALELPTLAHEGMKAGETFVAADGRRFVAEGFFPDGQAFSKSGGYLASFEAGTYRKAPPSVGARLKGLFTRKKCEEAFGALRP